MGLLLPQLDVAKLERAAAGLLRCTPREYAVLKLIMAGLDVPASALVLDANPRTIASIRSRLMLKCGCSREELLVMAHELEKLPAVIEHLAKPEMASAAAEVMFVGG